MDKQQSRGVMFEWWRDQLLKRMAQPDCPPYVKKRCRQMLAEAEGRFKPVHRRTP